MKQEVLFFTELMSPFEEIQPPQEFSVEQNWS